MFKNLLIERIDDASSIDDLSPLINCMNINPLQNIQKMLKDQIQHLDTDTSRDISYKTLSITDLLTLDVIQHILCFVDSANIKYVNKSFRKCHQINQDNKLREIQSIINEEIFIPNTSYDEKENNVWIVHPTKTHLDDEEIALGYHGPINDFADALNIANTGDKILLHDGEYIENHSNEFDFDKQLQIIGVGNVLLKFDNPTATEDIYFKNIKLDICEWWWLLNPNATIWMENCEIQSSSSGIFTVEQKGVLNAKNCHFHDTSIRLRADGSISIIGCTFMNCKETCIQIRHDDDHYYDHSTKGDIYLKCVGNTFNNNFEYAIAAFFPQNTNTNVEYVIKQNILKGCNGANVDCQTANRIYEYVQ